jgi:hypothetical protein
MKIKCKPGLRPEPEPVYRKVRKEAKGHPKVTKKKVKPALKSIGLHMPLKKSNQI